MRKLCNSTPSPYFAEQSTHEGVTHSVSVMNMGEVTHSIFATSIRLHRIVMLLKKNFNCNNSMKYMIRVTKGGMSQRYIRMATWW